MKVKKEYLILALVIIALAAYLLMRRTDRTLYQLPVIAPVAKSEITKIQITRNDTVIELDKKDNRWYIAPQWYPADTGKVKRMLDSLEKLTLTALVSESQDYRRYNLDKNKKITVKTWQADLLKRDFDVGKTAASFRHTFVKLADNDRVFHARGNFRSNFDMSLEQLRDKTVLAFAPADIRQVAFTNEGQSRIISRTEMPAEATTRKTAKKDGTPAPAPETVWQTAQGRKIDASALKGLLALLSNLHCEKFIDGRKKEDFNKPIYTLQLTGARQYRLSVFAKAQEKESGYPSVSSENDYPFRLSDSLVDKIKKNIAKLLQTPGAETRN